MKRAIATAGLVLVAAACSDSAITPTELTPEASLATTSTTYYPKRASGQGLDLYPGSTAPDFDITFDVRRDATGAVSGTVTWKWASTGALISQGQPVCMFVRKNQAFFWYTVTSGDPNIAYGVVGNNVFMGVQDNGEGPNAPADRHSYIYYNGPGDFSGDCPNAAEFILKTAGFPVEWVSGHVDVK